MKTHLIALMLTVMTPVLLPVVSIGAVIHVEEPQPLELTLGAPVGVDVNQDGSSDITVMYYGMPICIGSPEGGSYLCSLGVTLAFGSDLQLLGDPSSLDPVVLLPGQTVGPVPTQGAWLQTFTSPISLIYEFGTVSYARQGYPEYTGGLDRLAIGFRLAEEQSFRYGYMDVSLATWMPRVEGIVIADQLDVGLTVVQVPEPSIVALTVLGGVVLRFAPRRPEG
ncbi:MAG: hypothetical protein IPM17_12685 [Verrucomicrobia bacterium]|nr:hypothetical protein [Verrucomicrobiota bacterium]